MEKICCIGAGTIGCSWAALFAWNWIEVSIYDISKDALKGAKGRIQEIVKTLNEIFESRGTEEIMDRIKIYERLDEAVKEVDYVQESVAEKLEIKKELFFKLDQITDKETILATSTSGISISKIQEGVKRAPERCITVHPYNPPHLIPLVEIVPGNLTSQEITEKTYEFMKKIGKKPIIVKKDIPGMVANRLAAALWREAVNLVYSGVSTPEEIDLAIKYGPGIRWALSGIFLTYHLGGGPGGMKYFLEFFDDHYKRIWSDLANFSEYPPGSFEKILNGMEIYKFSKKSYDELTKWRDRNLIKLLRIVTEGEKEELGGGV